MAVNGSSYDYRYCKILYVLPVLWMTLCFPILGHMALSLAVSMGTWAKGKGDVSPQRERGELVPSEVMIGSTYGVHST